MQNWLAYSRLSSRLVTRENTEESILTAETRFFRRTRNETGPARLSLIDDFSGRPCENQIAFARSRTRRFVGKSDELYVNSAPPPCPESLVQRERTSMEKVFCFLARIFRCFLDGALIAGIPTLLASKEQSSPV